jgi:hypothetical protein
LIDVLDHVLDKGIVIDAWVRMSLMGLQLAEVEARIFVASIQTYLEHAGAVAATRPISQIMGVAIASDVHKRPLKNPLAQRSVDHKRIPKA